MTTEVAGLGTILSVWAHPDDESYLAGGLMALAREQDQRVVCVSATAGEHGTDDPTTWPPDRLGRLRRWEAAAAMAVLGVDDHRWLRFEDGRLAEVPSDLGVACIERLLADVRPDTIVTFGPDGMTFHPDHRAVSAWVTTAWRRTGARSRLLHAAVEASDHRRFADRLEAWGVYMTEERPTPVEAHDLALCLDLDECLLDRKIAALAAMHSQVGPAMAALPSQDFRDLQRRESFVSVSADRSHAATQA